MVPLTKLLSPHVEAIARIRCKLKGIDPDGEHEWTDMGMEGTRVMVKNWQDECADIDEAMADLFGFPGRGAYYAAKI